MRYGRRFESLALLLGTLLACAACIPSAFVSFVPLPRPSVQLASAPQGSTPALLEKTSVTDRLTDGERTLSGLPSEGPDLGPARTPIARVSRRRAPRREGLPRRTPLARPPPAA